MQMSSQVAEQSRIEIESYLSQFRVSHGRNLQARARRHLDEMLELLSEFLDERGIRVIATSPRRGESSLAALLDALDEFEGTDMQDALEGNREQLRVADVALRALTRQLNKAL
mgnify:CR=1 FL=1